MNESKSRQESEWDYDKINHESTIIIGTMLVLIGMINLGILLFSALS